MSRRRQARRTAATIPAPWASESALALVTADPLGCYPHVPKPKTKKRRDP